jgi:hypothetical protein
MTLPLFAANAARVIAWAMGRPEEKAAELIRFTTVATADPHMINRWAEALGNLLEFSAEQGGPEFSLADYNACIDWVAAASQSDDDALIQAKRSVFDEALRLRQASCP